MNNNHSLKFDTEVYFDINIVAEDLGITRQNINHHILKGHAGNVGKEGFGKTHKLLITAHNVITLITWLRKYGRGLDRIKLNKVYKKYAKFIS